MAKVTQFSVEHQYITPKQAQRVLRASLSCKGHPMPVCLCGKPGIAKSQIVQQVCKEFGITRENGRYHEIRASLVVDSSDLTGLPIVNKKFKSQGNISVEYGHTTKYSVPEILPILTEDMTEDEINAQHVIFFDEINRSSDPSIMNAIFQVVTELVIGTHKLLPNVTIFLALNPSADGYLTNSMDPALINRINFLYMNTDFFQWKEYAESQGIHQGIIDFLADNKDMLSHDGILKNEGQDKRFPTPRAWFNVDRTVTTMGLDFSSKATKDEKDLTYKVISGIVGMEAATKFITFMQTSYDDRPLSGDEVADKYLSTPYMQKKVQAKDDKGVRLYNTVKVQNTIDGITNLLKTKKEKIKPAQLCNILAFLCDIPVEQSMSFQNMLTTDISSDFTNWFFKEVTSNKNLAKLWKSLQDNTKQFSPGRRASKI